MSTSAKNAEKEQVAREKANQRVFISGLKGTHTLEKGVAYHYRGHYIYSYPHGNPILPVPFSTKKGINIVGLTKESAPIWDPNDPSLVDEGKLLALDKACFHEREFQREMEAMKDLEEGENGGEKGNEKEKEEECGPEAVVDPVQKKDITINIPQVNIQEPSPAKGLLHTPKFKTTLVPPQVASRFPSHDTSHTSLNKLSAPSTKNPTPTMSFPRINTGKAPAGPSSGINEEKGFTPHDRGQYLAYSAPGSRIGSVDHSRAPSPSNSLVIPVPGRHRSHLSGLRPVASTSLLHRFHLEEKSRRSSTPALDMARSTQPRQSSISSGTQQLSLDLPAAQDWIDPAAISAFVETMSQNSSRASSSRPVSRAQSQISLRFLSENDNDNDDDEEVHVGGAKKGSYIPGIGYPSIQRERETKMQKEEENTTKPIFDFPAFTTSVQTSRSQSPMAISPKTSNKEDEEGEDETLYIPLSNKSRPRAASKALNKAYNATNPSSLLPPLPPASSSSNKDNKEDTPRCPIHGDACDGEYVSEDHVTKRECVKQGLWEQQLPLKECEGGRVVIDWVGLRDEEVERREKVEKK